MKNIKLLNVRKKLGYTQQQIADCIPTDTSNYSRKENGVVSITKSEWSKIAIFLDVSLEDIYQEEITPENVADVVTSDEVITYIRHIEEENLKLKNQINAIKKLLGQTW